jgi:hypothetical protein
MHNNTSLPSRRDVLTTLRAELADDNTDAALRQSFLSSSSSSFDAAGFRRYLTAQDKTRKMIKDIVNYADRFGHVLQSRDASVLMIVSPRNRHHAMTALANLAKFTGQYDDWMQIKRRYSLKWSKGVMRCRLLRSSLILT